MNFYNLQFSEFFRTFLYQRYYIFFNFTITSYLRLDSWENVFLIFKKSSCEFVENNQHAISREKRDKLFRCSKSSPGEPVKINLRMPLILSNTRSHECPLKARGKRGLVTRDSAVRRRYLSEWGSVMAATGFESSAPGRRSGTARFGCQGDPRSAILHS